MGEYKEAEPFGLKILWKCYWFIGSIILWESHPERENCVECISPNTTVFFKSFLYFISFRQYDTYTTKENPWNYLIQGSFQHLQILSKLSSVFPSYLNCTSDGILFKGNWRVQQYSETTSCDTKNKNNKKILQRVCPVETARYPAFLPWLYGSL